MFRVNESRFEIIWLINQVQNESSLAWKDLPGLRRQQLASLLDPNTNAPLNNQGWAKRAVPLTFAALASIGLFGSGTLLGTNDCCELREVFGSCRNRGKENAGTLVLLAKFAENLAGDVENLRSETSKKFYMLTNKVSPLKQIQQEMTATENNNWKTFLFTRRQINFINDSRTAVLTTMNRSIKAYRSALYAYKFNNLNAKPTLLRQSLPMSLVPRDSKLTVIKNGRWTRPGRRQNKSSRFAERISGLLLSKAVYRHQ